MASPFSFFRKRQKVLLVVVGIICMFAFVIGGSMLPNMTGPRGSNPVVVTTKYGDLRESDLAEMIQRRNLANLFLQRALAQTAQEMQMEGMSQQFFEMLFNSLRQRGLLEEATETSVVDMMVRARKAEEMGIVVSDATIRQFLREVTLDRVSSAQFNDIVRSMRVSQGRVFDALRIELLASNLRQMLGETPVTAPPALRWEYYRRLNARATAEVIPVPVADFVGFVSDPPEAELQAFFNKYKNQPANPMSPEPGFYQPAKGRFQYFRADYQKFLAAAEAEVTDEDVAQYYEQNKEQFPYTELPDAPGEPSDAADEEPPIDEMPADEAAPEGSSAEEDAAADDATPAEAEASEETPSEETPSEETPSEETPSETAPADEQSSTDASDDEGPSLSLEPAGEPVEEETPADDESNEPQTGDDGSQARRDPIGRYELALADEEEPATAEVADEAPAEEAPAEETPAEEAPAEETPAEEMPAETDAESSGDQGGAAEDEGPSVGQAADEAVEEAERQLEDFTLPTDITAGPKPEYDPLWKVEDQIRRQLAAQRASAAIETALGSLTERMNAFYDEHYDEIDAWRTAKEQKQTELPSVPTFDVHAAAEGMEGIEAMETELVSALEASEQLDIGRTVVGGNTLFVQYAFESLRMFMPRQSEDLDGNRYLFWKIDETDEFSPTLDQVRDQVVEAWKLRAARELAIERADELAAQAQSEGKKLSETFASAAGVEVIDTGSFTWLTHGSAGQFSFNQPPRLSEVKGVENVGHDFMREVFRLEPGQVGVALNAPETVVYVVRVDSIQPSEFAQREVFMVSDFQRYALAAVPDLQEQYQAWDEQLREEAGVDWVRMPR